MTEIKLIITGPEEAYDYEAEFWCANGILVRQRADGDHRPPRRTVAPGHRPTRGRLAVADGRRRACGSAGRGESAPG